MAVVVATVAVAAFAIVAVSSATTAAASAGMLGKAVQFLLRCVVDIYDFPFEVQIIAGERVVDVNGDSRVGDV